MRAKVELLLFHLSTALCNQILAYLPYIDVADLPITGTPGRFAPCFPGIGTLLARYLAVLLCSHNTCHKRGLFLLLMLLKCLVTLQ